MKIQVLVDNLKSYIVQYAQKFVSDMTIIGHSATLIHDKDKVQKGDVLFLLSCEQIFRHLDLNKHNIVIHASDLPQGRGWSPLTWQVIEGKNVIPVTLFEAVEKIDAGDFYLKDEIILEGHELLPEIQHLLSTKIIEMATKFVKEHLELSPNKQIGKASFYPKRTPKDSELDIHKTIDEQFNLLRVCDNEKYPAFFYKNGVKYLVKIEKE
jgi:methionyl-tRNA formyltransferase